jgi:uncharacterized membrane protein YgaE (UPF0421/DUF939 family)
MRDRLRDPVWWTNASQLLKTVVAVVVAWLLAVHVFHVSQAFLAPWAALLTVHATVYRSVRRGAQQVGATVIGVLAAFAAGAAFGLNALSLGAAVLVCLVAGSVRGLRSEATTAAATALVVLTTGYSDDSGMLFARLLDTAIGIGVGLLVNLLVWPPLRDRSAAHRIDRIDDCIGELLSAIADGLRAGEADLDAWTERIDALDDDVDEAWAVLSHARESGRLNPRRAAQVRMRAAERLDVILTRLEHAVGETRSMVRTIELARVAPEQWDERFRGRWLDLLARSGAAIASADTGAVAAVRRELDAFAGELPAEELEERLWPLAGALLVNLRNILEALDVVADAQPVRVPAGVG